MGACAAVAYLLGGGNEVIIATAAAIGFAVMGQVALVLLLMRSNERHAAAARKIAREVGGFHSELRRKTEGLQGRLDQVDQVAAAQTSAIAAGFADLKMSYVSLQNTIQAQLTAAEARPVVVVPAPVAPQVPVVEEQAPASLYEPEEPAQHEDQFVDHILFSLEPVVDVQSGRTVHYRMHLELKLGDEEFSHDKLMHYAGRVGRRAELDLLALREAFVLLDRLRQRDPELNIFVGIGAETLADAEAVAQIEYERQSFGDGSHGVVFEMPHAMLAGLSEQGLEGLAALARSGAHFALANVSVNGLDLNAMNTLNVRHVGLAASAIDPAGPSTSLIGFAQMARLSRVSVIVMGLNNPALVGKIAPVARLACGPCFAAPRRVKRELAPQRETSFDVAA